jgi:hypothetical protein
LLIDVFNVMEFAGGEHRLKLPCGCALDRGAQERRERKAGVAAIYVNDISTLAVDFTKLIRTAWMMMFEPRLSPSWLQRWTTITSVLMRCTRVLREQPRYLLQYLGQKR